MTDLRRAGAADAAAIAEVCLAPFHAALPTVRRAPSDDEARGWIEQRYVAPDRPGEGIGRRLLDLAKARADGPTEV